jgi:hypothetical protein
MNNKPMILENNDLSEGVYAASGDGCYTTTARIHQTPETGRGDYRIQVDADHHADHTKEKQWLHISFNQPVVYKSCNAAGAQLVSGSGSNTLVISMTYHQNPTDRIGFGDLIVESEPGLAITGQYTTD